MQTQRTAHKDMKTLARGLFVLATALACLFASTPSAAAVTLPSLFSDHMVVQRNMAVPIWGTDTANQSITVKLGTQQATATTGSDGKWTVRVPAQDAGGPFSMTVTGSSTVTVADVYVGEVWIGSGQSNMDFRVHCTFAGCVLNNEAAEIAAANYPLIRFANIPWNPSATPREASAVKTSWSVTSPQTVSNFSAAGYFFSRELAKTMPGVAIGFVLGSFGASCLQCWMSKESLQAIPSVATQLAQFEANPDYTNQHNPYICYNGQIAPLIPYAIRGVIWYQGESVTWNAYRDLQIGQVTSWRKAWGQDFTFIITQLPNYSVSSSGWPVLREAQLQTTQYLPNTGLAVLIDIGNPTYVHPADKQDVGLRLGLVAESVTYGQDVAAYGPLYDHMAVEGSSIRLYFTHTEAGVAFKGDTATGFEIAGADGNFVTATAVIQPDSTILVSAASVTAPKNVHYCWAGNPTASLFNKATPAIPSSPFRTEAPALPGPPIAGPDGGVVPPKDSGVTPPKDSGVTPPKDASVVTGDAPVVVTKDGGVAATGGAGGTSGAGGAKSTGGSTGAGGSAGTGGSPITGGTADQGGNTSSGGNTSPAASGGSKGNAASGGAPASGGNGASGGSIGAGGSSVAASTGGTLPVSGTTDNAGCSCRLGSRASRLSDTAAFVLGVLLVLGARRNRRKQRS